MPYLMREKMFPRYYFLGITIIAGDRQHCTADNNKRTEIDVK
jgi:hypothetical protein